jgi:4-hydroxybenzoate polyprenyltransferase
MSTLALYASISRLHIIAIASLGTFTFGWLFLGRYPWLLAAVCALDWFVVNLLNRVVDIPEDRHNGIRGTDFVARHRGALATAGFATLIGSLCASHLVLPEITPLRLAYHALGLSYNWRLLPGGRRIKQLYFWKNTASAVGFLITVFGYPLAAVALGRAPLARGIGTLTILCSAIFFFLFELSFEVIYDLRDAPGDAREGVRTYPVVHGQRGAARIIDGLIAGSLCAIVAGYAAGVVPWRIFIMGVAPLVQLVLYKRALGRGITSRDCILITWLGAGLLCAYHLWVKAGLPGVGVS